MKLGLEQSLNVIQDSSVQQQIMILNEILSWPAGVLECVLDQISDYPEYMDALIKSRREDVVVSSGVRAAWGELHDGPRKGVDSGGICLDVPLGEFEDMIDEEITAKAVPGVYYKGVIGAKPIVKFGKSLEGKVDLSIKCIPPEYKYAREMFKFLAVKKDWIDSSLRRAYAIIGDKQREFLERQEPTRLHSFTFLDLAKEMDVDPSAISRLMRNRYALVSPVEGEHTVYPIRCLTPSNYNVKRHLGVSLINEVLEKEAEVGVAYSDTKIVERISGAVTRRAVCKYREAAKVPTAPERKRIYSKYGAGVEPFYIPHF